MPHDRRADLRADVEALARAWVAGSSRCLVVVDGTLLADIADDNPRPAWLGCDEAPPGERYLLGGADDAIAFAVHPADAESVSPLLEPGRRELVGLRELAVVLTGSESDFALQAVALANWHATHPRCSRCGEPTTVAAAGYQRRCAADGSEHYPRTDPAVIMAVVDGDDRILLGHQVRWPDRWFSTLAGFVEPGESAEQAVAREVAEEVGIVVAACQYRSSQSWPFPSSLMLGFTASVAGTGAVPRPDGEEISEARWFTRDELLAAVTDREVRLPPPLSVARALIEDWFGSVLPGGW